MGLFFARLSLLSMYFGMVAVVKKVFRVKAAQVHLKASSYIESKSTC